ncbi:1-deoxy-D-xylulose 5-phosphate reductoisomerase [Spirochaeta thermophila DSM 6578]|uniref:1-deoxy-D-xylulose 5-phosphate reductoisomerase n=1 Tax=Winmispira thermophila (strain ATCC 700085 / DSM 6578 / Z-1203) TaxID=869211 RepID=G0GBP3_WINT7|nr:1-deoxy-D-xylulose-5-phosphate reductoisomerase [Spirochaeta thermophila]AEJ61121.1 1-deoxy-D-xylulose 5-phosphate reductoisomerase [Spirochaeta thermophila DSM 6578]
MKKRIIVLGCTGSIGRNALEVVRAYPERLEVVGLSAHTRDRELLAAAREFGVERLALTGKRGGGVPYEGEEGLLHLIEETEADIVVNGIAGTRGLLPSLKALETGKDLALANKESLVVAGELLLETATRNGRHILPVDSEHAAIFSLLRNVPPDAVKALYLTASGGALRDIPLSRLEEITPEEALRHPTWEMGPKITIDSATLANKGLEVIEAAVLFGVPPESVRVVIHPQSVVHGLILLRDGSWHAQMSTPDMRLPIQQALFHPEVPPQAPAPLLLEEGLDLSFRPVDGRRYPMLGLAYQALASQGKRIAFNAANEEAVRAFLERRISFPRIAEVVESVLAREWPSPRGGISPILALDAEVRRVTEGILKERSDHAS